MANDNLYIDTDMVIEVQDVENGATGVDLTGAAVTVTLRDASDDSLILEGGASAGWPLTLAHSATGTFQGVLRDTLDFATCMTCNSEWVIDGGTGLRREWTETHSVYYAVIAASVLIDNTDHLLTMTGLEDALNPGTYFDAADTVEVTLKDTSDVDITGETWPLALSYIAASSGDFQATLKDTLGITVDDVIKVLLVVTGAGSDQHREWRSILTVTAGT